MSAIRKGRMGDALRWALESSNDPARAAADWLASDISGRTTTAVELLADPMVSLDHLRKAKSAFKTMRIVGETSADRRLAARLYLCAIATALVRHDERISAQSDAAVLRAIESMMGDAGAPEALKGVVSKARAILREESTADEILDVEPD